MPAASRPSGDVDAPSISALIIECVFVGEAAPPGNPPVLTLPPRTMPTNDVAQEAFPTMASGSETTPNLRTLAPGNAEGLMGREERGAANAAEPRAARQPPNRPAPAAERIERAPTASQGRSGARTAVCRPLLAQPPSERWVRSYAPSRFAPHRLLRQPTSLQPQNHRLRLQLLTLPLLLRRR